MLVCCNMVQRAGRMVGCGARAGLSVVVKRRPDVGLTEVQ